jgi:hypothetical protein
MNKHFFEILKTVLIFLFKKRENFMKKFFPKKKEKELEKIFFMLITKRERNLNRKAIREKNKQIKKIPFNRKYLVVILI